VERQDHGWCHLFDTRTPGSDNLVSASRGAGEFSATTGKLITILGAWRAPVLTPEPGANVIAYPHLLGASEDASVLIGEAGGHAFVVRNGHRQPIPRSANIGTALGSSAPGGAW
jgi:hypothetical protein